MNYNFFVAMALRFHLSGSCATPLDVLGEAASLRLQGSVPQNDQPPTAGPLPPSVGATAPTCIVMPISPSVPVPTSFFPPRSAPSTTTPPRRSTPSEKIRHAVDTLFSAGDSGLRTCARQAFFRHLGEDVHTYRSTVNCVAVLDHLMELGILTPAQRADVVETPFQLCEDLLVRLLALIAPSADNDRPTALETQSSGVGSPPSGVVVTTASAFPAPKVTTRPKGGEAACPPYPQCPMPLPGRLGTPEYCYHGVSYRPRRQKWSAQVTARNVRQKLFIGEFLTARMAAAAMNECVDMLEASGFSVKLPRNRDVEASLLPVSSVCERTLASLRAPPRA